MGWAAVTRRGLCSPSHSARHCTGHLGYNRATGRDPGLVELNLSVGDCQPATVVATK